MTRLGRTLMTLGALVPALVLLGGAELALRWHRNRQIGENERVRERWNASMTIHRKSDDPTLVYELTPGSETVRNGVEIRINAAGFRDDEFPADPSTRRPRVVLLGDSVAWGWGVPMDEAFPQLLERRLAERAGESSDPIVFNLAVDGYSTAQEIRLLETVGRSLDPDLVVVAYVLNDPDTSDGGLARYYRRRLEIVELAKAAIAQIREALAGRSLPEEYHQRVQALHAERTVEQFARLGELATELGAPILVAVVPVFQFALGEPYPWANVHERLEELCSQNGLAFLDLYESFRGSGARRVAIGGGGWHPNVRGHAMIADALDTYVRQSSWELFR